ncbi:MAG: zinc-dependent alcohol dehydrogenase family protein [Nitrospiraceae bacterium]|nr:zinc-dependent alcohol dehydrogenase family protein [Nitrospiraceae bacterium]
MKAMLLRKISDLGSDPPPLEPADVRRPIPEGNQILVRISRCGVCHTDLDVIEGRTPPSLYPLIPGHQIVGRVEELGPGAKKKEEEKEKKKKFRIGDRVGIGWINSACGKCGFCLEGRENLCDGFKATGRDANGGYAEYTVVPEDFAYPIPEAFSDSQAAPLLCAGTVGYRSFKLAGIKDGQSVGLTGFGGAGHLVLAMILHKYPASKVFVFARSRAEQAFAMERGAYWSGGTEERSPEKLSAIIDTTPAWKPVAEALKNLEKGGRLVINAIRKVDSDKASLLSIDYTRDLWMEKEIKSVANVTRRDFEEFLPLAAQMHLEPEIQEYPLEEANKALLEIKQGKIRGAKVLRISY